MDDSVKLGKARQGGQGGGTKGKTRMVQVVRVNQLPHISYGSFSMSPCCTCTSTYTCTSAFFCLLLLIASNGFMRAPATILIING